MKKHRGREEKLKTKKRLMEKQGSEVVKRKIIENKEWGEGGRGLD